MARIIFVFAALLAVVAPSALAAQERQRQVVYIGNVYDAQGYSGQFYPANEQTIYLLADVPNVLAPRTTEVYWWPTTREFKADWDALDEHLTGTIEAGDQVFPMTSFSLRYDGGYDSAKTGLLVGAESTGAYEAYQKALVDHRAATTAYNEQRVIFEQEVVKWGELIDERRSKGESTADLPPPPQPVEPEPVSTVVTTPDQGFAITLPAGTYQLRLRAPDGSVVAGSERTVVAFSHRREGLAYKVIAASKWTRPEASTEPIERIYVQGENALYIQPAAEREYDAFYYAKLLAPQQKAVQNRRGQWTWVQSGPFDATTLTLAQPGQPVASVERRTFYVRQKPGGALGYDILPYDESLGEGISTFEAFELRPTAGVMTIAAPGIAGSTRTVSVVRGITGTPILALAAVPLSGLAWVFGRRWRKL